MATVNYIRERKQTAGAMKGVIDYVCRESKTKLDENTRLVSGKDCIGRIAFNEFMATKSEYEKTKGIFFYQYVQSFSPKENITPKQAHEIGIDFAKHWEGYEVLVATHIDAAHIHNHLIINSVGFESGKKLRQNPKTLVELRKISDEICNSHGLSTLKKNEKNNPANYKTREYRAASKGKSWKYALMSAINKSMKVCAGKQQFINNMNSMGYKVRWEANRKNITFTCPNGMKCRDNKLHNKKYLKEMIENEFRIRKEIFIGGATFGAESREMRGVKKAIPSSSNGNIGGTVGGNEQFTKYDRSLSTKHDEEDKFSCFQGRNGGVHREHTINTGDNFEDDSKGYNNSEQYHSEKYGTGNFENEGVISTGWEREREVFAEIYKQAGTAFEQDRQAVHNISGSINGINVAIGVLSMVDTMINTDERRFIRDCTTIKNKKRLKRKKEQKYNPQISM